MESPLDKIARLEKELAQIKQSLQIEVKLEPGKWYRCNFPVYDQEWLFLFSEIDSDGDIYAKCSIFLGGPNWHSANKMGLLTDAKNIRLANPDEIKSALTKEAEKRGFKEGITIGYKPFKHIFTCSDGCISSRPVAYYEYEDGLYMGGILIYKKGIWAEIIKDTPITICGYGVIFHPKEQKISIDGNYYSFDQIRTLHSIMSAGQVKSLNVGCNEQEKVTLETIERIIAKIND